MKAALFLLTLMVFNVVSGNDTFKDWKSKHNKQYSSSRGKSETEAEKAFKKNVEAIKKHNEDPTATYKQGVNDFADTTKEERAYRFAKEDDDRDVKADAFPQKVRGAPPASLSYVSKMTPIKSQQKCGSCWAFAATAVLEYWGVKKPNQTFSEQNLVDCVTKSKGCNGGSSLYAFQYAAESGISDGSQYVYVAKQKPCQRSKYPAVYKWDKTCGAKNVDESKLKIWLANNGPLAVAIDATESGFNFYKSGVFSSKNCSQTEVNHGVTLVGYGTDAKAGDYWIARNSWGTSWGEKGDKAFTNCLEDY